MSASRLPPLPRRLLHPRYWPAWLGVAGIQIVALLPYRIQQSLGRGIGRLAFHVMSRRRHIAARNLALCFPQLDAQARSRLLRKHFVDIGRMLCEFAAAWLGSDRAIRRIPVKIHGLEHIAAAQAAGRGVLLVGAHFSHLELCARLLSQRSPIAGMYRVMDSPVFEHVVLRARLGYARTMFTRDDLRGVVRDLRRGGVLWYAPDQDMLGKDYVFAPFFGVPAATITATHHLARMSGAAVIPFFHRRLHHGGYVIHIRAPLPGFPSDDVTADTARINAVIERMVEQAPAQYLWIHRRFKTRPPGQPNVY